MNCDVQSGPCGRLGGELRLGPLTLVVFLEIIPWLQLKCLPALQPVLTRCESG